MDLASVLVTIKRFTNLSILMFISQKFAFSKTKEAIGGAWDPIVGATFLHLHQMTEGTLVPLGWRVG